jgi:putative membrane protein
MRHASSRKSSYCLAFALIAGACGDDDTGTANAGSATGGSGSTATGATANGDRSSANGGTTTAGGTSSSSNESGTNTSGTNTSGTNTSGTNTSGTNTSGTNTDGTSMSGTNTSADAATIKLSDAEVAMAAVTVNMGEVDQGTIAVNRAQSSDVRAFGQMMVDMHSATAEREMALAASMNIVPTSSAVSDQLRDNSSMIVMQLNDADAASFDKTYTQSQVDVHQKVLNLIDTMLLPSVQNDQLRVELTTTRADVESHLAHATDLAAKVNSNSK